MTNKILTVFLKITVHDKDEIKVVENIENAPLGKESFAFYPAPKGGMYTTSEQAFWLVLHIFPSKKPRHWTGGGGGWKGRTAGNCCHVHERDSQGATTAGYTLIHSWSPRRQDLSGKRGLAGGKGLQVY